MRRPARKRSLTVGSDGGGVVKFILLIGSIRFSWFSATWCERPRHCSYKERSRTQSGDGLRHSVWQLKSHPCWPASCLPGRTESKPRVP